MNVGVGDGGGGKVVGYVQVTNLNKTEIRGRYFYQRPYIEVRSLIEMPLPALSILTFFGVIIIAL